MMENLVKKIYICFLEKTAKTLSNDSHFMSFRRRRNLREKLDKDWVFVAELLVEISPSSK